MLSDARTRIETCFFLNYSRFLLGFVELMPLISVAQAVDNYELPRNAVAKAFISLASFYTFIESLMALPLYDTYTPAARSLFCSVSKFWCGGTCMPQR